MGITTLEEFYKQMGESIEGASNNLLLDGLNKEIGHFNIFSVDDIIAKGKKKGAPMPYDRRAYYKISLVRGKNIAEYADKTITIDKNALLFATPKIPYNWSPQDEIQTGYFCIFTTDFLLPSKSGVVLDELPLFQPGGYPLFQLTDEETNDIDLIFRKMYKELSSDYAYKYDLLRNYVLELIHYGQKLQPLPTLYSTHNASARVSALFVELLERQFPIESPHQKLNLRTANDFASQLAVHVNHLNKVLKENTGKTTTAIISTRIIQEAKILLKQTNWNISEISYSLGFEQVAHFSNFFKKQTSVAPLSFRE